MASIFTKIADVITPWNRKGEVQRRVDRKRRDEELAAQRRNQAPTVNRGPSVRVQQDQNAPQRPDPKKPVNIFEDLNKGLVFNKPASTVQVNKDQNTQPAKNPAPGTVVDPTSPEAVINRGLDAGKSWEQIANENNYKYEGVKQYSEATRPNYGIRVEKPKQTLLDRARDVVDANTQADKYRRQEGNRTKNQDKPINLVNPGNIVSRAPVVGTVTKMVNTAGAQGPQVMLTAEQQLATAEQSAADEEYRNAVKSGDRNRIAMAQVRARDAAFRVQKVNKSIDKAGQNFKKNKGGLFNAGTLYDSEAAKRGDIKTGLKDIMLPAGVAAADIYTLGKGNLISEGLKEGGVAAVRTQAPNIVKAGVGNFASGAGSTVSEGGNAQQAVKAGLINSVLGLVPDVLLPTAWNSLKGRVFPGLVRGKGVNPGALLDNADEAAASASAEGAVQATRPRPISVTKDIPVTVPQDIVNPVDIPVTRTPSRIPLIKELQGDFNFPKMEELQQIRVDAQRAAAEDVNRGARPDMRIEGVTPRRTEPFRVSGTTVKTAQDNAVEAYASLLRDIGEGNGVDMVKTADGGYVRMSNNFRMGDTAGKRMTKDMWLDEARRQLEAGNAEPSIQKAFNDAANPEVQSLLAQGEQPPVPEGRPIQVKQVNSIPVVDRTDVPVNMPETPGQVRPTAQAAPNTAKSAEIATQTPPSLPAETQAILDNPRQFSKRQVEAARNQRKMARQVAKANEDTAAAVDRINTASPAAQSGEGFVPTGEFGKSANGGPIQKVSRAAEMQQAMQETSQMSPQDVLQSARKNQLDTGGFNRRDIRNIAALFESKRLPRGSAEWNEARQILKEDGTVWGQTGALRNYTMRRTATTDELVSRYESKIYRLADDPSKIDGKLFDQVEAAEETFTQTRDEAMAAYNRFTENPTRENARAYHAAQDAADKADMAAKRTEYTVADKILRRNKDIKQARELEKMANAADMYQMDAIDASMLSGTGTFIRNFVNAGIGGAEEGLFGRPSAWISRRLTGESVGGGIMGRGSVKGLKEGASNIVDASAARFSAAGKNPLEHLKNWSTTGNQLGDSIMDAQVSKNVLDHYKQLLKSEGYSGRELVDRASVMARQDPNNVTKIYQDVTRTAAGLGSGVTRNNKIETVVRNMISDTISAGKPNRYTENLAKLVTRMTIGYPTAIGRSAIEGVKRFTLGAPTFVKAAMESDPAARAVLIKEGLKQAGTGSAVIPPLFYALGQAGIITGAYPESDEERARWTREGISENSIRIGGDYYQLPAYLGSWAIPGLFYASLGRNGGDWGAAAKDTSKIVPSLLPTEQASNVMDVVNGKSDLGKFMAQTGASAVRAVTPAGALLNQIAKSFDPTKNDTNSGTNWENFIDKVLSGVPGVNNMANIPTKEDDAGNPIKNPGAVPLIFGAQSSVQGKGEQRSAQIQSQVDSTVKAMQDAGVLGDKNLRDILDDDTKLIYDKVNGGKKLGEGDLKKLQDALTKGVSKDGTDTAYLERGQYDTNLAALRLKKQLMEADKTVKPSDIKGLDVAITRGEVYRDNSIPYELISDYQKTSVEEWRKMGDPESDSYDPEMYQRLWDIDKAMTDKGVSYRKGALDKQKFYAKESKGKSGRGGRGGSGSVKPDLSSDFGTLKTGVSAPRVQEYDNIDIKSGGVPRIAVQRPNIVHKISSSG